MGLDTNSDDQQVYTSSPVYYEKLNGSFSEEVERNRKLKFRQEVCVQEIPSTKRACKGPDRTKKQLGQANTGQSDLRSELLKAFEGKDLASAKELVRRMENLNMFYSAQGVPSQLLLGLFVTNACKDAGWLGFYKDVLSEGGKIDLNANVCPSGTALSYACREKNKDVAELLLKHGADVNKESSFSGETPILIALKNNDHNLASLLFRYGAKLEQEIIANSCEYKKETMVVLLEHTSHEQNTEILKRLSNNITSESEGIEIVELLLSKSADPFLGEPNAMQLADDKGNAKLVDLFNQKLETELDDSFVIIPDNLTLNKIQDILNNEENDAKLIEVINNIQDYKSQFICNFDNSEEVLFMGFSKKILNLQSQFRDQHVLSNILMLLQPQENGRRYSVKELLLLAIAANNELTEKHKDMLFAEENLSLLHLLVGSQKYIEIFTERFSDLYQSLKNQTIQLENSKVGFFSVIALREEQELLDKIFVSDNALQDLKEILQNNTSDPVYGVLETASLVQNEKFTKKVLGMIERNAKQNINTKTLLKKSCITLLEAAISQERLPIVEHLCKKCIEDKNEAIQTIYKEAFVDDKIIETLRKQILKSIGTRGRREIYDLMLKTASSADNIVFLEKVLDLVENDPKFSIDTDKQDFLEESLVTILENTVANECSQIIDYICYKRFSKISCPATQEVYMKAFTSGEVAKDLDDKIEKHEKEKSTEYEWWVELKKYLVDKRSESMVKETIFQDQSNEEIQSDSQLIELEKELNRLNELESSQLGKKLNKLEGEIKRSEERLSLKQYKALLSVLTLQEGAQKSDVVKNYKILASKFHTDKWPSKCQEKQNMAGEIFKKISAAHSILKHAMENGLINNMHGTLSKEDQDCKDNTQQATAGKSSNSWSSNQKNSEACLFSTFKDRDLTKAKELIEKAEDLNIKVSGESLLHCFVKNACQDDNWFKFLKELLFKRKGQIDFDICDDKYNETALNHACRSNNKDVVKLLLDSSADVNKISGVFNHITPIIIAMKYNYCGLARLLFGCGAEINVSPTIEQEIINNSHKYKKETLKVLLQHTSSEQNTEMLKRFANNKTLENEDIEVVKLFLNKGADPSVIPRSRFTECLLSTFSNKDLETAKLLIDHIDLNKVFKALRGGKKIVEVSFLFLINACLDADWFEFYKDVLKDGKIDINAVFSSGCTALGYACKKGKEDVIELLLSEGADVDKGKSTPIYFALKNNNDKLASLLFKYGVNINTTLELEQAIIANSYSEQNKYTKETMEVLLQHTSTEQNTEILKCFSNNKILEGKDIEIVKLLLSKGANPYFGNPSAAELATDKDNTQLTDLFSQSQLDSESQETQVTSLNFEDDDNEFYDAEEDIVKVAGEDKSEQQATTEASSNGQSGDQKSPEPESASNQQMEKMFLH